MLEFTADGEFLFSGSFDSSVSCVGVNSSNQSQIGADNYRDMSDSVISVSTHPTLPLFFGSSKDGTVNYWTNKNQ